MLRFKVVFRSFVFLSVLLSGIFLAGPLLKQDVRDNRCVLTADSKITANTTNGIAKALIKSDFEGAREYFKGMEPTAEDKSYDHLKGLLDNYDHLVSSLNQEREAAYREHLDKLTDKVELARWRKSLLATSETYTFDDEAKAEQEEQWREEIKSDWQGALAQMVACHNLAERMQLEDRVDSVLREEIIAQCLTIAEAYEAKEKGLDAYSKVYALLAVLDEQTYDYDELYDQLVREATLKELYAPDPNMDGVKWEERRRDITYDMIYTALASVSVGYVEEPDFHEMARTGVHYCQLLAETEAIQETFNPLEDTEKSELYVNSLKALVKQIDEIDAETFGFAILIKVMDGVVKINEQSLVLPKEVVLAEFAEGVFSALDNYTYIVWPADVADFRKEMTNQFSGIGVVINKNEEDILRIDSLVSYGAAAYKAGLDAGDLILEVDGKETKNITLEKAVHLITGPTGTDVQLLVQREGFEKPKLFKVTRRNVVVPTVKGVYRKADGTWEHFADVDQGIGYIRLTHFSDNTPSDLRNQIRTLKRAGMKALVLDLRGNSGGYLNGAVDVVDTFVSDGRIVSSRYRDPSHEDVKKAYRKTTVDEDLPLVVLINSASASASEIVAGALKDHQRATVIGTRSFGKGNVQTIQDLRPSDAQMKMTIAYYYLPNGRRVHRDPKEKGDKDYGVEPDIFVELTGKQIDEFLKVQHDAGVLHRDDIAVTWDVFGRERVLKSDPQLQMALLSLRGVLLARTQLVTDQTIAYRH